MDSLITAAALARSPRVIRSARSTGSRCATTPALALRGIAMAQLGDLDRAKLLLRRAGRTFSPCEAVAQPLRHRGDLGRRQLCWRSRVCSSSSPAS
jgi:hypothetical protein